MRVILDTNVFVSGIFFGGPPYRILKAWRDGELRLVVSQEILNEYQRVGEELAGQFPGVDPYSILELKLLKEFVLLMERFASRLGTCIISAEPLFYRDAIQYERNGFGYLEGRKQMEEIDRGFLPGERLYERLDGSTPFRMKGAEKSVRGRSWAIQDGILGGPCTSPKIYKPVGKLVG